MMTPEAGARSHTSSRGQHERDTTVYACVRHGSLRVVWVTLALSLSLSLSLGMHDCTHACPNCIRLCCTLFKFVYKNLCLRRFERVSATTKMCVSTCVCVYEIDRLHDVQYV